MSENIQDEKVIKKANSLYDNFPRKGNDVYNTHYCAGCGHGILHKLIAEVMDELEIQDRCVMISPVGCSVFAYYYFNCGNVQTAHGRAPAVATGISRAEDNAIVMSYQGDGDLASIGLNETLQAANRGEKIAVFFVNNTVYGMTGGQMAPTTLIGMKTVTCPYGRNTDLNGFPLVISDILAKLDGTCYVTRQSVHTNAATIKAKKAIRKAFENAQAKKGTSVVEFVSACNTGWKKSPIEANAWMEEHMFPKYPLGDIKDTIKGSQLSDEEKNAKY